MVAFAKMFGNKMATGNCVNKESGEVFKACSFTDADGNRTFVGFSNKLGALSPAEIAANKSDLQVVQLESGNYKLCSKGESTWEDVDLGL